MSNLLKWSKFSSYATVLFISIFMIICSSYVFDADASSLYNADSRIIVDWDSNEFEKPVIPRDEVRKIDLSVTYTVDTGEHFGEGLYKGYKGSAQALIKLEILGTSSWCSAVLEKTTVPLDILKNSNNTAVLFITIDDDAPSYGSGFVTIKASLGKLGLINGFEKTFNLSFTAGYKAVINSELPKGNIKEIEPMSKAVFPIELENIGNEESRVILEVKEVPKGWTAVVTDYVILDVNEKGIAYLSVTPPKDFGFQEKKGVIKVSITPTRSTDLSERGETFDQTFIVKSMGTSTGDISPGVFVGIIAVIIVILFLVCLIISKKVLKKPEGGDVKIDLKK